MKGQPRLHPATAHSTTGFRDYTITAQTHEIRSTTVQQLV
jgi:hypothetical protein